MDSTKGRTTRHPILIISHDDGHLEVFADKNIDVHIERVPVAHSREAESWAADVCEARIPYRYRELLRADRLRKTGTTRPLLPSVMRRAMESKEAVKQINALPGRLRTIAAIPDETPIVNHSAKLNRERRKAS